jgi:hypothetical protein
LPRNGQERFAMLMGGVEVELLTQSWSNLCRSGTGPPPVFRAVHLHITTVQGNRFRLRGGNSASIRDNMERLLQDQTKGHPIRGRLEG